MNGPIDRTRLVSRLARAAGVLVLAACALAVQDACIIAEPSGELPRIPASRPTILHASVVPSTSAVLTYFPSVFIVPVELADPTVTFSYAAFIDYNPNTGEGLVVTPTASPYEPDNTRIRTRMLSVGIPAPLDLDRCHVIEIIVALTLDPRTNKTAHTPAEPGGDEVRWFYNPNGGLAGCPALDAGIEASVDASADADAAESGSQ